MEPTGTITRRAAKGIPPRVRSPPRAKRKAIPKKVGKELKRHASESGDENSEESTSDDSGPKVKKRCGGKRQRTDKFAEEEEMVDENVEPSVEDVDDIDAEQTGDDEVSTELNPY
jgi:hypothetical protein